MTNVKEKIEAAINTSPKKVPHNPETLFKWFMEHDQTILAVLEVAKEQEGFIQEFNSALEEYANNSTLKGNLMCWDRLLALHSKTRAIKTKLEERLG